VIGIFFRAVKIKTPPHAHLCDGYFLCTNLFCRHPPSAKLVVRQRGQISPLQLGKAMTCCLQICANAGARSIIYIHSAVNVNVEMLAGSSEKSRMHG
jgi:hypothetical protein